jgi:antitoxin VapB
MLWYMQRKAKLFTNGRSQAVRLPAEFRFTVKQVFIRKDPATGDVILSARPESWQGFFQLPPVAADFLKPRVDPPAEKRDPLA